MRDTRSGKAGRPSRPIKKLPRPSQLQGILQQRAGGSIDDEHAGQMLDRMFDIQRRQRIAHTRHVPLGASERFLSNVVGDYMATGLGVPETTVHMVRHPISAGRQTAVAYKELAQHPIRHFQNEPVTTFLQVAAPIEGGAELATRMRPRVNRASLAHAHRAVRQRIDTGPRTNADLQALNQQPVQPVPRQYPPFMRKPQIVQEAQDALQPYGRTEKVPWPVLSAPIAYGGALAFRYMPDLFHYLFPPPNPPQIQEQDGG